MDSLQDKLGGLCFSSSRVSRPGAGPTTRICTSWMPNHSAPRGSAAVEGPYSERWRSMKYCSPFATSPVGLVAFLPPLSGHLSANTPTSHPAYPPSLPSLPSPYEGSETSLCGDHRWRHHSHPRFGMQVLPRLPSPFIIGGQTVVSAIE